MLSAFWPNAFNPNFFILSVVRMHRGSACFFLGFLTRACLSSYPWGGGDSNCSCLPVGEYLAICYMQLWKYCYPLFPSLNISSLILGIIQIILKSVSKIQKDLLWHHCNLFLLHSLQSCQFHKPTNNPTYLVYCPCWKRVVMWKLSWEGWSL